MATILAVDDDPDMLGAVRRVLEDAGHTVNVASHGQEALDIIARQQPDLLVLDIIMPEMSGIEVCRHIRADPHLARLPIIFLTAKGRPSDVAQGLDVGGDDYLTKPFEVLELPARVRALLRRIPGGELDPGSDCLIIGNLRLHRVRPQAWVNEEAVELTTVQHRLLHYLMLHAGQVVSIEQLLQDVWDYPPGTGDPKLIHAHIANLRAKIEPEGDTPRYILNAHGRGYLVSS